jgi:hypothetical protein
VSWNYRIVRHKTEPSGDEFFEVCEVYYDDAGKPFGYVDANICGETLDILRADLARIAKDIEAPVLDAADITAPAPFDTHGIPAPLND